MARRRHKKAGRRRKAVGKGTKTAEHGSRKPKGRIAKKRLAALLVASTAISIGIKGDSRLPRLIKVKPGQVQRAGTWSRRVEKTWLFRRIRFPPGLSKRQRTALLMWANNAGLILSAFDKNFIHRIRGKKISLIFGGVNELKKRYHQIPESFVGDAMTITVLTRKGFEYRVVVDWKSILKRGDVRYMVPILIHELGGHVSHADKLIVRIQREGFSEKLWAEDEVRAFTYSNRILEEFLREADSPEMKGTAFERMKPFFQEALRADKERLKKWKAILAAAKKK